MPTNDNAVRFRVSTQGANKAIAQLSAIKQIAVGIGVTFGALALGRAFVSSIKLMKEFELTMARVRAISGATQGEFNALSKTARELGATTIFSARQAAEGMVFLSQAGFEANETIQLVSKSLLLAQAGSLELAEAADIVAKTIKIFSLEASEGGRVVDVLAKAAASANTNVSQMGHAISFVGPVAKTLNIDLEQTAALIGIVSDRGIQAGRAGTGLRQVLLALVNPTSEAAEKLEAVGINVAKVAEQAKSGDVEGVLRTLKAVFQDAGLATEIFGRRAIAAAFAVGQNIDQYVQLRDELRGAAGSAEEMARIMNDTLFGAFRSLRSAIEEAGLQIGDTGFAGALTDLIKVTAGVVSNINGMLDAFVENNRVSATQVKIIKLVTEAIRILTAAIAAYISVAIASRVVTLAMGVASTIASGGVRALALSIVSLRVAVLGIVGSLFYFGTQETKVLGESISRWRVWLAAVSASLSAIKDFLTGRGGLIEAFRMHFDLQLKGLADTAKATRLANEFASAQSKLKEEIDKTSGAIKGQSEDLNELFTQLRIAFAGGLINDPEELISKLKSGSLDSTDFEDYVKAVIPAAQGLQELREITEDYNDSLRSNNERLKIAKDFVDNYEYSHAKLIEKVKTTGSEIVALNLEIENGTKNIKEGAVELRILTAELKKKSDQVKKNTMDYDEYTRAIEENNQKIKRSVGQVIDSFKQLLEVYENFTNKLDERRGAQQSAAQIASDIRNLQDKRNEEANRRGKDGPDRGAIATYDTEILRLARQQNNIQFKLGTELSESKIAAGGISDFVSALTNILQNFGFQGGGVVQGYKGKPVLSLVHGGEAIFNPKQLDNLNSVLDTYRNTANQALRQKGGGVMSLNFNVKNESGQNVGFKVNEVATNSNGGVDVRGVIKSVVRNEIANGGLDSTFKSRFGLGRNL